MQAHGQLMAGAGGGYFSRSVDSMMFYIENTAKTNKLSALALFTCLGAMDTFVFVPDVPMIYSNIWNMIKNY